MHSRWSLLLLVMGLCAAAGGGVLAPGMMGFSGGVARTLLLNQALEQQNRALRDQRQQQELALSSAQQQITELQTSTLGLQQGMDALQLLVDQRSADLAQSESLRQQLQSRYELLLQQNQKLNTQLSQAIQAARNSEKSRQQAEQKLNQQAHDAGLQAQGLGAISYANLLATVKLEECASLRSHTQEKDCFLQVEQRLKPHQNSIQSCAQKARGMSAYMPTHSGSTRNRVIFPQGEVVLCDTRLPEKAG